MEKEKTCINDSVPVNGGERKKEDLVISTELHDEFYILQSDMPFFLEAYGAFIKEWKK
jgi:hypothetical protein